MRPAHQLDQRVKPGCDDRPKLATHGYIKRQQLASFLQRPPRPQIAYLRLQSQLDNNTCVDDKNWGLEAGLNAILNGMAAGPPVSSEDITRAIASEARRERHRAHLRRKHLVQSEAGLDPRQMVGARSNLSAIRSLVSAPEWDLLIALGKGYEYQELGKPGRLRVRVSRLRQALPRDLSTAA